MCISLMSTTTTNHYVVAVAPRCMEDEGTGEEAPGETRQARGGACSCSESFSKKESEPHQSTYGVSESGRNIVVFQRLLLFLVRNCLFLYELSASQLEAE